MIIKINISLQRYLYINSFKKKVMKNLILILFVALSVTGFSQQDSLLNEQQNLAEELMNRNGSLTIGGYAQIDYNQPINNNLINNGVLDVHRLVMLFGYKFNSRTNFITEIEFEHVKEVYVEQAFLNYKITNYLNFRGGLMLIPMGIINEYHEPPTFNGVERPSLDNKIIPTTWREIGMGFTGRFNEISLKYQLYVVNGLNGYNDDANFSGAKGLRSGRQKGAESIINSPNFASRIDFYGIRALKIGLSGYFGKSQSSLFNGLDKSDNDLVLQADSSVVGISMFGADLRYNKKGFQLKAQYNYTSINNASQYNKFAGSDLGSALSGYYLEFAYNIFELTKLKTELIPFVRYENYNTHFKTNDFITADKNYHTEEIIFGFGWKLAKGAVLKADYQYIKSKAEDDWNNQLNLGIGIMF